MTPEAARQFINRAKTREQRQARKNLVFPFVYGNPQPLITQKDKTK